jgi:hypothetical protein
MFRKICLVGALICFGFPVFSQQKDFQTWADIGVSGELLKKLNFEITPEIKLSQNSSFVKSVLTDVDLSYPVVKFIQLGIQYRFEQKNINPDLYYLVNRFGVYARTDFKLDKFRFNYRLIYQQEYEGYNHKEDGDVAFKEHRHRIAVSYYKKSWKLRPSATYELFLQTKPNFLAESFTTRLSAGVDYRLTKNIEASLGYKLQTEYNQNNPKISNILALGISYKL